VTAAEGESVRTHSAPLALRAHPRPHPATAAAARSAPASCENRGGPPRPAPRTHGACMKQTSKFLALLCVVTASLTAGCAALLPKLQTPHLSVIGVEVVSTTMFEQRFNVKMRVQNPNDRALPIRGLTYTMQLAGQDFGRGMTAKSFTVPALGEAEFDMIVTTNLATNLLKILPALDKNPQSLEYRLEGKVNTDLGFIRTIPFTETGRLAMK
jgi:LEA14-like dessication related protein